MYNTENKQGEKRMRVRSLLMAGAALALGASVANAAIVVTTTTTPGTGGNAGFDVIRFFGRFGTTDPESVLGATGLQSVSGTLQVISPDTSTFKFRMVDENGDDVLDADTNSSTVGNRLSAASNGTVGTNIRIGGTASGEWTPVLVEPVGDTSRVDAMGNPLPPTPEDVYGTGGVGKVKMFRVEGANPLSPDAAAKSDTGPGALFAVAVVPTGTTVRAFGQIAADRGLIQTFDTIPEPTAIGFVGLGLACLTGRRRRA